MGANPQIQVNLEAPGRKRHTWDSRGDWSNPPEEGQREVGVATQRGANPFSRTTGVWTHSDGVWLAQASRRRWRRCSVSFPVTAGLATLTERRQQLGRVVTAVEDSRSRGSLIYSHKPL